MSEKCGSKQWLKAQAWFACGYCEDADEITVHRPDDLKMWHGKTICDDCFSGCVDDCPDRWADLDQFNPFACFEEPEVQPPAQPAVKAVTGHIYVDADAADYDTPCNVMFCRVRIVGGRYTELLPDGGGGWLVEVTK